MQSPSLLQLFGLFGVEITAASVQAQLDLIPPGARLLVRINSDGGLVSEAVAVYAALTAWPGGVDTEVVGWALSAASLVFMAGGSRRIHATSMLMVHAPWTEEGGNANELRQRATVLDSVARTMQPAYARSGQSPATVAGWLDGQDHWFTADEALGLGLATEIVAEPALAMAPCNVFACRHTVPYHLNARLQTMPTPSPSPAPAGADAIRAEAIRAESQRRNDISAAFEPFARRNDIDPDDLHALRASCEGDPACSAGDAGRRLLALMARGVGPANPGGGAFSDGGASGRSGDRLADFRAAATDALMIRAGIQVKDPHPALRDVRGLSVVAMAERILSMRGESTRDLAPAQILAKGMSTSDFTNLLAGVAGKSLRDGYMTAPATHALWTAEREVPDFKPATLVSLSEAPNLLLVPELAEYKHGALSDSATNFKADTFGRIILISRQALMNDDLAAFTTVPALFGQSARRLEADKVYATLQSTAALPDGTALFHASRGNLAAAGAPISVDSIGAGRAMMRKQKDIAGLSYLDPQPRFLIVPVVLETMAEALLASLNDPTVSSTTTSSRVIPEWIRGLQLVADPRLDEVSATAWYLAANPQQMQTIVRAYLSGEDRPYIEENAEFNRDAVATKARLDLAVGVVDWRGLVKNPGA